MPPKKPNILRLLLHPIFALVFILIGDHFFRLWAYQSKVPEVPGEVPYIIAAFSALVYLALVLVIRRMTQKSLPA